MKLILKKKRHALLKEATFANAKSRIEEDKLAFFVVSAARSERGGKYSRKNISAGRDLKSFLQSKGLSYTIVDGGYTEKVRDKKTKEPTGEVVVTEEESYLVFGNQPHYGREESAVSDVQELFEIAKEACLVDPENPQESFSFGYPRTVSDPIDGERTEMFIALYENDAPRPGAEYAFTDWGGPWNSFEEFTADEGAYTKVRGTKGAFAQKELSEAQNMKVRSVAAGRKKHAKIKYWIKMNKRWESNKEGK